MKNNLKGGPIEIGKNNIIEENCIIINRLLNAKEMIVKKEVPTMVIGNNNHFQVGCTNNGSQHRR